jgi:Mrp family chromosome partitioning ATPase
VHDRRAARKQYQQIANGVLFLGQRQPTVVAVTGVTSGPSGAFAAAGVAEAVARAGLRVALVDADLESGTLSALAAAENVPGLSEVLLDGRPVEEVAHATRDPGYELVPVGSRGIEAARTGPVNRLRSVITNLRRSVDVVVVTAPSTADSLDAQLLAGIADGVVVAMEAGRTQQGEVEDAADQMQVVGANVLGGVLLASGRGQGRGQGRNSRSGSAIRHRAIGSASNRQPQQTVTDDVRSSSLSADLLGERDEPDAASDGSSRGTPSGASAAGSSTVAPPMQSSAYRSESEGLTRSAWPTGADARD